MMEDMFELCHKQIKHDPFSAIVESFAQRDGFEYESGDSFEQATRTFPSWSDAFRPTSFIREPRMQVCHSYGFEGQKEPTLIFGSDSEDTPGTFNGAWIEYNTIGEAIAESPEWANASLKAVEIANEVAQKLYEQHVHKLAHGG